MPWSLEDIGEFALDLAKDITGVTNFQNASDAFKRANATANAVDGDVGKAITSLPSYAKDIGVGLGQAVIGAGTALTNLIPATKAKKAADVITKTVTGGTKTAATKAEVLSTKASKNADDAKAAAKAAGEEAAAAKKAAEAAAKKVENAKNAEAAKKANEAKLKADKEAKEALTAKKEADAKAKEAAAEAKRAADVKAAADKALAAEKAAAERAAATAKAKQDAEAQAQARKDELAAQTKAREDAAAKRREEMTASQKAREDELAASTKAREDAAIKRREDAAAQAKAREEAAAAAKAKRDADSAARTKAREDAAQARKDELAAKKAERDAAAKAREEGRTKAEQEAAAAKARKDAEDAAIKAKAKKDAEDAAAAKKKKDEEDAAAAAAKGEDVVVTPKVVTPKILDPDAVTTDGEDTDVVTPPPPTDTDGDGIPDNIDATPNGDGGDGPDGEELPPPGGGGGDDDDNEEPDPGTDPGADTPGSDALPIDGGEDGPYVGEDEEEEPPADQTPKTTGFEKTWLILRAKLIAAGLPVKTVDRSVDYFRTIISEGSFSGDTEINDVVDQYLYIPEYTAKNGTKLKSPYYEDFGSFNDNLKVPKKPSELVPLVLGYEKLVDKYSVSEKFKNRDSIQKYLQNDTSVAELDERMNAARLRGLNADPNYLKTLQDLGYISSGTDLTDFFLDPAIGKLQLESRRQTAAFATEAVRRSSAGITLDTASAQSNAARLTALGYSEAQVASLAGTGYENIAEQLNPTTALSGMYEKTGESASALAPVIQKELEAEQFLGMASQRRKKLAEQNIRAFQGQSGISRYGLNTGSALGAI